MFLVAFHTAWVRVFGVLDFLQHEYQFGEIVSMLGIVLDVDIGGIERTR
jgi:hypothetical protein